MKRKYTEGWEGMGLEEERSTFHKTFLEAQKLNIKEKYCDLKT